MIPLKDDNPTRTFPLVTIVLIVFNTAIFLWELVHPLPAREALIRDFAVIPYEFTHFAPGGPGALLYNGMTLLTAMFLHGSVLHVAGNMLYLWIFGNNVEDAMGKLKFIGFYLAGGVIAAIAQYLAGPNAAVPTLGASGAIAAVLGGYAL
ncbi:MAG TPA: rhomboid family intramembrane serine protease, partial [Candidatus Polarisedimenticolia bacterium]|nr:rhomboid family intramembrane serine protease [Candidatus Polarisedimenticolia bacterium]